MFFVVQYYDKDCKNNNNLHYILRKILKPSEIKHLDPSTSSINTTYISENMATLLENSLDKLPVLDFSYVENMNIQKVSETRKGVTKVFYREVKSNHTFSKISKFNILRSKALKKYIKSGSNSKIRNRRKDFLNLLVARLHLVDSKGFDLPSTKIGKELGIPASRVSDMIHELVDLNLLEVVRYTFLIGYKAKTYRALNQLKKLMHYLIRRMEGISKKIQDTIKVNKDIKYAKKNNRLKIKSGTYNATIFKLSYYYMFNQEELYRIVKESCNGFKEKERLNQVKNAFKVRARYRLQAYLKSTGNQLVYPIL